jgi:hypothetical protein
MHRRTFLGALAAGVGGLAGCIDGGQAADSGDSQGGAADTDDPTTARTPTTDTATDRTTDTAGSTDSATEGDDPAQTTVTADIVTDLFAVPEVVAPDSPDSFGVFGERGEQFVVAMLDTTVAESVPVADVSLSADGQSFPATTEVGYGAWELFDLGEAYDPEDYPQGWIVVPVSKPLEVDTARLTWPGGEHVLGDDALARLARPPTTFAVESFEVPETVTVGETMTATATVTNTGDTDGTFVAALNRSGPLIAYAPQAAVRLSVAAGATETWTFEYTADPMGGLSERSVMDLHFHHRDGSLTRTVTVEPATTEA